MRKKFAFALLLSAILLILTILIILMMHPKGDISKDPFVPEPTQLNSKQKEGKDINQSREEYFAMMHRTSPSVNYKKMDRDLLEIKMRNRTEQINNSRSEDLDTLANGYAIGTWNEIGSYNVSGRIWATEIDFNSNTIYAFSDGGNLWKGDLDGTNWAVTNDNFKIASTNLLRKIDDRLIVSTAQWGSQGIYFSNDEGVSWTETTGMENVEAWGYVYDAIILNDAEHTMYTLAYNWDYVAWNAIVSLYKSTDLGVNFTLVKNYDEPTYGGTGRINLWCAKYGSDKAYLVENDHFYYLDETGEPQFMSSIPLSSTGDVTLLCGYENDADTRFYIAAYNYAEGNTKIYRSTDAGISWAETGIVESYFFSSNSFYCSQKVADKLYIGGVDVYTSDDGGVNWEIVNHWYDYYDNTTIYLHADIPYIESFVDPVSENEILLISTDGGLFKSENNADDIENITLTGMRNAQYYDAFTYHGYPELVYAGAQDQGFQISNEVVDGKYYFDQIISGDYGHIVSTNDGQDIWTDYPGFIMYIKDASESPVLYLEDFVGSGYLWLPPIMEDPEEKTTCWWAGGKYLYQVDKVGVNLIYDQKDYDFSNGYDYGALSALAFSPLDYNYWYALNNYGIFYYSTDRGITWQKTNAFDGPDSHYFYGSTITPSKTDLGTVYIGGSGYENPAVYVTHDNGETFSAMADSLPNTLVYDMAIMPNDSLLFAATEVGPYVYVQDENRWYDLAGSAAPYQVYWSVEYVDTIHAARFATYGRGIFEFRLDYPEPEPTYVSDFLENNNLLIHPNPVSASNTRFIQLNIPAFLPSAVVSIYTMQGEKVLQKKNIAFNKNIPYKLPIESLPQGNYIIAVTQNNKSYINKLIVSQ